MKNQNGIILLEGLIAILIFSMGILAMVGLQAAATRASTDSRYRAEAALYVNEIIGEMWVADKTNLAAYASPSGANFITWLNKVKTSARRLPAADATITVAADNLVTVSLMWTAPQDPTQRRHVVVAQINDNLP